MSYQFPLDETWSKQEMIDVVNFFVLIEKAYEQKVERNDLVALYRRFKEIVPGKSQEKQLFKAYRNASDYEAYPVIKKMQQSGEKFLTMK